MFYKNLQYLSEKKGKKLSHVMNELGFSSGNLTKWKNGIIPKINTIQKIAEYFDVSTEFLLTGKEKTTDNIELSMEDKEVLEILSNLSDEKKKLAYKMLKTLEED